jgi:hypothetical protein
VNWVIQIACPIEVHKTRWVSNRLVDPSNTLPRGLMPVMKTYALDHYCQHVGFCSGTHSFEDEM